MSASTSHAGTRNNGKGERTHKLKGHLANYGPQLNCVLRLTVGPTDKPTGKKALILLNQRRRLFFYFYFFQNYYYFSLPIYNPTCPGHIRRRKVNVMI